MSNDENSEKSVVINVFLQRAGSGYIAPRANSARERLESFDSPNNDNHSYKLYKKLEDAENRRNSILENRIRALSEKDEKRYEKVEAIKEKLYQKAVRRNDIHWRAE